MFVSGINELCWTISPHLALRLPKYPAHQSAERIRSIVGTGLGLLWLLRDDEQEATVDDVPIKLPSSAVTAVVQPVLCLPPITSMCIDQIPEL
jgi:hypothetical protein